MLLGKSLRRHPSRKQNIKKDPERFRFTTDWFCGNEKHFSRYLTHLVDMPCQILEIGSYEGRATVWLLENIATHPQAGITCIDIAEQLSFRKNILAARSPEKVHLQIGLSRHLLRSFPANTFDFIYVDGGHGSVEVLEDAVLSFLLLKRAGIMAFDDYKWKDPSAFGRAPETRDQCVSEHLQT